MSNRAPRLGYGCARVGTQLLPAAIYADVRSDLMTSLTSFIGEPRPAEMVARQLGPSILPERCYCRNVLPWRAHCILRYLVPHATSSSSTYALFPFRSLFRFRFRFRFLLLLFFFFLPFERGMAHNSLSVCVRAYTLLSCRHHPSINDCHYCYHHQEPSKGWLAGSLITTSGNRSGRMAATMLAPRCTSGPRR